jgi:hypothetical protein
MHSLVIKVNIPSEWNQTFIETIKYLPPPYCLCGWQHLGWVWLSVFHNSGHINIFFPQVNRPDGSCIADDLWVLLLDKLVIIIFNYLQVQCFTIWICSWWIWWKPATCHCQWAVEVACRTESSLSWRTSEVCYLDASASTADAPLHRWYSSSCRQAYHKIIVLNLLEVWIISFVAQLQKMNGV